ncbi:hypothetical protein J14TS2_49210 [Bacillus sp. J14TS2]|uniref:outer membrane protein assembly factor BamB family protein n=1 Tax=Bacillus sp. J14TS2 TaxID=2807188 RepID=UPI001B2534DC|nr:PQQ-binding-like beta-propeller repeat protein [Bacillus sp. J14TS2]GIN74446.1 hypothetical protein J14TS2_49210 [Bacillus sp. J14TS2]
MKKIVLLLSMVLFLVMAGCASNAIPKDDEKNENTTTEEEKGKGKGEDSEGNEEETSSTPLASIDDFESISIDEYDQDNWIRIETDKNMENRAFLDGDQFFINTENNETVAYTKDMKEIWHSEVPYPFRRPSVKTDDYILVNNETEEGTEAFIEALDKETGDSVYKINLDKYNDLSDIYVIDDALYFAAGLRSKPDDMLFSDEFTLYKYNVKDGSLIWEQEIGALKENSKGSLFQLAFHGDLVYYVSNELQLTALQKETGEEEWTQDLPDNLRYFIPIVAGDILYILDGDSVFHSYDATTGEPVDEYEFPGSIIGPVAPYPIFKDSLVIYQNMDFDSGDTTLIAADMEAGEETWSIDFGQHFIFGAYLMEDTLYLLTQEGGEDSSAPTKVLKLEPETGELIENIELNDKMAKAANNQYLYMENYINDEYLALFFERTAYFIK